MVDTLIWSLILLFAVSLPVIVVWAVVSVIMEDLRRK